MVSVIVMTYNSAKYVLETLESIKSQSYKKIELLITDDYSSDSTIALCEKWLATNQELFLRTVIITAEKNTGIAANCNRGLAKARGEWIKYIAGDDVLLDNCLEVNVSIAKETNNSFIFTKVRFSQDHFPLQNLFHKGFQLFHDHRSSIEQFKILIKNNYLPAPAAFLKRSTVLTLGGFDERFPMLEDYPMWLKAAKNSHIIFSNVETVIYRIHDGSVSQASKHSDLFYPKILFLNSMYNFHRKVLIKEQFYNLDILRAWDNYIGFLQFQSILHLGNKKNFYSHVIFQIYQLLKFSFYYKVLRTSVKGIKTKCRLCF